MNNYNKYFFYFSLAILFIFLPSCAKKVPPKHERKPPHKILKKPKRKEVTPAEPKIIEEEAEPEKEEVPAVPIVFKLPSYFNKKDASDMALIPGGYIVLKDDPNNENESPAVELYVSDFYIDIYEITNRQYKLYKENFENSFSSDCDLCPVTDVTWHEAENYCMWAEKRLPAEAEWEKAARGTQQLKWPWGNSPKKNRANLLGNTDSYSNEEPPSGPLPVGSFPKGASIFGVFDLAGNVWEWTSSFYLPYNNGQKTFSPDIRYKKQYKVLRGGSWKNTFNHARTTFRHSVYPDLKLPNVGFRCVKDE